MKLADRTTRWWLVAAALATASLAEAGVVHTRTQILHGEVVLGDASVRVGDKTIKAADIIIVDVGRQKATLPQPNAVRWTNGEVWRGRILSLRTDKLRFQSALLGTRTREVDTAGLGSLDFHPNLRQRKLESKTLYRRSGEPLPGALLWIGPEKLAVDSPLGALTLGREGVTRYVVQAEPLRVALTVGAEMLLQDGSVFRGLVTLSRERVKLRHPLLGDLSVPGAAVRSIVFHRDGVMPLPASMRIEAGGRWMFRVPTSKGKAVLRMMPAPLPTARGEAVLRVTVAGKVLLERTVPPEPKPAECVTVAIPRGPEATISVSFARQVRLPCGVILKRAYVVMEPDGRAKSR